MQNKRKNSFKTNLKKVTIIVFFLFLQSVPVYAEKGELKINNQVIYEKSEGSQSNSATFTIHQLFMKDMSERDQQINDEKINLVAVAQRTVFTKKSPEARTVSQQVTPNLFSKSYVLNENLDIEASSMEQGDNLNFILFGVIGGIVVLGAGILLGRSFPKWLKKT